MEKARFPWRDFLKKVAVIAVPVALQNLLTTTGSMVDTMMIASLGPTQVGAVGLCAQFSSLMFSGYWGFVGGGMLFFSQYWGAKDDDGINRSYGLTLTCMMTVGLLFGLLAILFPEGVMRLYTDKESIRAIGVEYLRIVGFGYPLTVFSMAMAALLRCTGRVRVPLYGSVAGVASNIFLNWVLIFGNLGAPAMGVRGAALATVLAQAVNICVVWTLARRTGHPYLAAVSRHFRWTAAFIRVYLRKCFPIILNEVLIGLGNMVINIVLGRQPEEAIAALAVFRTLEGLIIGFFAGFSNASSVLVGTEVGAGHPDLAYSRAWRLVYLCQGFIGILGLALIGLHTPILHMMGMQGESFRIAFGMICVYAAAALIRMGNWTQNDTFRAAGDATTGTVLEIVFMWLMVLPLVWLSGMVWKWPTLAVFAFCYADEPIRYVIMQLHLFSGKWIRPVTPEGVSAMHGWKPRKPFSPRTRRS
ncbi:MAG: MATE family efflux transporter [Clostridia bacterium]|nr:MATE family efflux transporter [Clostridia bacterium]MBQ6383482.1 MATE family efflux transporter [Clostridia bacterium]MBQ6721855.1 MATE family efflux transporter [Clostridia bacterium]MBQ9402733.1 MATE family efflux transporter [Clostridia bacterium]